MLAMLLAIDGWVSMHQPTGLTANCTELKPHWTYSKLQLVSLLCAYVHVCRCNY